jgi:hypothetical protein
MDLDGNPRATADVPTHAELLRYLIGQLSEPDPDPDAAEVWGRYYQGVIEMWLSERVIAGGPPRAMANFECGRNAPPITLPWNSNERRLALIEQCLSDGVEFEPLLDLLADDMACTRPLDALLLPGFVAFSIATQTGESMVWLSEEAVQGGPPAVLANMDRGADRKPFSVAWDSEERRTALREICEEQGMDEQTLRETLTEDSARSRPAVAMSLPGFQAWLAAS